MSVIISDVDYSPSPESGENGATPPPRQGRDIGVDEILAILHRERERRARLWAD